MDKGVANKIPRIILTPGEPAGIGPDIVIKMAQQPWQAELLVVADPALLISRAKQLNLPLHISTADCASPPTPNELHELKILPVSMAAPSTPGVLSPANSSYVINTLSLAAESCLAGKAHALVTGPVHKGIINEAQIPFLGHTEFFANLAKVPEVVMLFVAGQYKIALATTHLPLRNVPDAITPEKLTQVLRTMQHGLQQQFHIANPRISICGLNPHAGENGHLGREEIEIIEPTINRLRAEGMQLKGPLSADTIFTDKMVHSADAILAMYHDQALPVVKYMDFGSAVNVTLGLPFIRTSVDHGTALDLAGSGAARPSSLFAAVKLAIDLANKKVDK